MSAVIDRPPTAFEEKVYEAVSRIPIGKVATYAEIGREIQCRSPRAIGQALRRNPYAPTVPCHRVVASNLSIGGFAGETEGRRIEEKKELLVAEGVSFSSDSRIDRSCRFAFA